MENYVINYNAPHESCLKLEMGGKFKHETDLTELFLFAAEIEI